MVKKFRSLAIGIYRIVKNLRSVLLRKKPKNWQFQFVQMLFPHLLKLNFFAPDKIQLILHNLPISFHFNLLMQILVIVFFFCLLFKALLLFLTRKLNI